ncbi:MAG: peptidoglycan DD-metalloendopeptidase family protein, partial [Oscillospiraceae bacterium]|nr:peptidoglycan DD-metalloendopeptidase family protein [Oscillospiraceae bacterium]
LSSADFSDFLSRVELTNDFLEYDKKLIQKLADDKTLLENKKAEREVAVQRCNEILKQSENKKIELDQKISDVNTLINNLKYQEEYYKQLADQDAQEAKDLKDLMTLLQKQIDEKAKYEGDMRWPLQIVSDGSNYITSNYGYRTHPVTGETESFHNGIDIGTNGASPPVYAANSGKVIYAAPKGTYGNCVIIDHGSGISTLYAHLSVIKVKSGTTVKKGDLIGYVGSTGRSTGNHLHFTVMLNGSPVFPGDYVKIPYKYPVK